KEKAKDDQSTELIENSEEAVITQNQAETGMYKGVLPCADCEGIETVITLNDDHTYSKTSTYLKGENSSEFQEKGVYELNNETQIITLIPEKDDNSGQSKLYQLEENHLHFLNRDGEKVEGEMADLYIL